MEYVSHSPLLTTSETERVSQSFLERLSSVDMGVKEFLARSFNLNTIQMSEEQTDELTVYHIFYCFRGNFDEL